jgi:hypothetical protein
MSPLPLVFKVLGSELFGERVVELFHGDLSIAVVIESSHEDMLLVVGHVDVQPI